MSLLHNKNISLSAYLSIIALLFSLVLILLPYVYIKNQIYYKSVIINALEKDYEHLKRENKILKIKYKRLYFHNNIKSVLQEEYKILDE